MKKTTSTNLIACAVIAGAFTVGFASGPAFAQHDSDAPFEFHFNYSPNELATVPQAEALLVRLERDVRRHCGGNRKMSIDERRFVETCIDTTMKDSIAKFGSPAIAQAFQSRADG
jgi:UrcA family protein